ncbi:hypothetical protein ADUPG1_002535, partial [Aduncisulcus paluster]
MQTIGPRELFSWFSKISKATTPIVNWNEFGDAVLFLKVFKILFPKVFEPYSSKVFWNPSYYDVEKDPQVTQNWEVVRSVMSDSSIPLEILNPNIRRGEEHSCYNFAVMLYFLYHLMIDLSFSADFSFPVSTSLATFLQSPASVECLINGGSEYSETVNQHWSQQQPQPAASTQSASSRRSKSHSRRSPSQPRERRHKRSLS